MPCLAHLRRVIAALLFAALALVSLAPRAAAAEGPVLVARHEGTVEASAIRWRAVYELRSRAPAVVDLAYPLPPGSEVEPSDAVEVVTHEGRVVGLRLLPAAASRSRIVVTVSVPRKESLARLTPPLCTGDGVQITTVTGADDLRFEPDPRTGLARHVGFFAPIDLPPSARDAADRAIGYARGRTTDDPMYVRVSPALADDEGIRGAFSTAGERTRTGALGALAIFVAVMAGLGVLHRRLSRAARVEQAERTLAAAFERLEGGDRASREPGGAASQ